MDVNVWITIFLNKQVFLLEKIVNEKKMNVFRCQELTNELKDVLKREKFKNVLNKPLEDYISVYKYFTIKIPI